jgi:tetratricopeptide (TPR) repeat protein
MAASYGAIGNNFAALGLLDVAEACDRLAVGLNSGHDLNKEHLADVLMRTKKYDEAESIYLALLAHTSDPSDKWALYVDLRSVMFATGRKSEADKYGTEADKLHDEAFKTMLRDK